MSEKYKETALDRLASGECPELLKGRVRDFTHHGRGSVDACKHAPYSLLAFCEEFMERRFVTTTPLDEKAVAQIRLFRLRSIELDRNWQSLLEGKQQVGFRFQAGQNQKVESLDFDYDIHRLKGLYLDYRVFESNREITNFLRLVNLLKRHFTQAETREVLDNLKRWWQRDPSQMTWLQFGFDEICDLIFNSRLFHNDAVKYQKLEKISYGMTDNAMHSILVNGIFMRTQIIIVLRRIIDNTEIDCQEIALQ